MTTWKEQVNNAIGTDALDKTVRDLVGDSRGPGAIEMEQYLSELDDKHAQIALENMEQELTNSDMHQRKAHTREYKGGLF